MRNQRVTVLSKKHQNVSPGGPLWLQNGLELSRERTKNSKIVKICSFFSLHFFSTFFDGVKFRFCAQLCKNVQKCPAGFVQNGYPLLSIGHKEDCPNGTVGRSLTRPFPRSGVGGFYY